jgi:hypothetical protein
MIDRIFRNRFRWLIVARLLVCPSFVQSQSDDWPYAYFFKKRFHPVM